MLAPILALMAPIMAPINLIMAPIVAPVEWYRIKSGISESIIHRQGVMLPADAVFTDSYYRIWFRAG